VKYKAIVHIMPREEILDPQGKATLLGLGNLGFKQFDNVRIGKRIELEVQAANEAEANQLIENASKKLLANPIIETYQFELTTC